ncbi:unnamed protein product [Cuscuta campestris]|uniref:CCHC-type domain-containing protein n=1 Tax=Cuscuta campestris TaxID=132261 RepID=A0A484LR95_9ASTE|nr:unnamed protein product [Cuscuta campestris]
MINMTVSASTDHDHLLPYPFLLMDILERFKVTTTVGRLTKATKLWMISAQTFTKRSDNVAPATPAPRCTATTRGPAEPQARANLASIAHSLNLLHLKVDGMDGYLERLDEENVDNFPIMTEEDFLPCTKPGEVTGEDDGGSESQTPSLDEERIEQHLQKEKSCINNGENSLPNDATAGKEDSGINSGNVIGKTDGNAPANKDDTPKEKKSFASLFERNRSEEKGMKLHQVDMAEDEVFIQPEDVTPMEKLWGPCLVGCFTGRFPSLSPIQSFVESWKVPCQFLPHHKGWVIFKPPPSSVKVNFVGGSYMQHVEYEDLPLYCYHCEKFGHTPFDCFDLHEMERKETVEEQRALDKSRVEVMKTSLLADNDKEKEKPKQNQ